MRGEVIPFPGGVPVVDRVGDLDDFMAELVKRGFDINAAAPTPDADEPDIPQDAS